MTTATFCSSQGVLCMVLPSVVKPANSWILVIGYDSIQSSYYAFSSFFILSRYFFSLSLVFVCHACYFENKKKRKKKVLLHFIHLMMTVRFVLKAQREVFQVFCRFFVVLRKEIALVYMLETLTTCHGSN